MNSLETYKNPIGNHRNGPWAKCDIHRSRITGFHILISKAQPQCRPQMRGGDCEALPSLAQPREAPRGRATSC
eukprot:8865732-Pyramimonas_sp.AAC.1